MGYVVCLMIIAIAANVTIIWTDVSQEPGGKLIWTPLSVYMQTVTRKKI